MSAHIFPQTVAPASSTTEPRLPPELEREIFTLALMEAHGLARNLFLVAHRVHEWLEPILYRTVFSNESTKLRRIAASPILQNALRRVIFFDYSSPSPQLLTTRTTSSRSCAPSLLVYAQNGSLSISPPFYPADTYPTMDALADSPTFASLSHFDVIERIDGDPRLLGFLIALPALTHVSYNHDLDEEPTRALLNDCKNLVVLVRLAELYHELRGLEQRLPVTDDPRLVVCAFDHWWDAVLDGETYWDEAEDFVRKKRAGEIPHNQFYLRDPGEEEEEESDEEEDEESGSE
ncbi:hypothetical protein MKEN_01478400 [Mycena kentingensis (nom. inval.)]|nr:hypothetical protein MKEN_01478400 [Mycena kentingensis (nom. inval.)]